MAEVITPKQLGLLQLIGKHPGVTRDQLLAKGAAPADLAYLEQHDMIREREAGQYRVSHFGEMVLKRSL